MDSQDLVSVIIPNFNQARFIGEAIRSVLVQSHSPLEILVGDDGSTDDSRSVLRALSAEYPGRLRVYAWPHGGANRTRNRLLQRAKGSWIQLLDADDVLWDEHKIRRQVEAAKAHGLDGVVSDWTSFVDSLPSSEHDAQFAPMQDPSDFLAALLKGWWAPPFAYLWSKARLDRVGGFAANLPTAQDTDLNFRIAVTFPAVGYVKLLAGAYRDHGGPRVSKSHPILRLQLTSSILDEVERSLRSGTCAASQKEAYMVLLQRYRRGALRQFMGHVREACETEVTKAQVGPDVADPDVLSLYDFSVRTLGPWVTEGVAYRVRPLLRPFVRRIRARGTNDGASRLLSKLVSLLSR